MSVMPLAPSAELLWEFMSALCPEDPGGSREIATMSWDVRGPIDATVLREALVDLVRRHPALRTVIENLRSDPALRILPDCDPPLELVDLSGLAPPNQDERLAHLAAREAFRAYDLRRWPLWNTCLVRLAPARQVLTVSFSHLVADGWSCAVFTRDLVDAYRARLGVCPPPPDLPADFRQASELRFGEGRSVSERQEHWRRQLLPLPPYLPFAARKPGADVDLIDDVAHRFAFPVTVTEELRRVAWRARTTAFVALMAAYHVLLARRTGMDRIVVGTTTLGRDTALAKRLIGQFTNNTYVAARVRASASLIETVAGVDEAMKAAVRNVLPYRRLAAAVNPAFETSRPWPDNHLFDSYFQAAAPSWELDLPGLSVRQTRIEGRRPPGVRPELVAGDVPACALAVWAKRGSPIVILDDDRRAGSMVYSRSFFDEKLVRSLAADYVAIVEALTRDPSQRVGAVSLPSAAGCDQEEGRA